MNQGGKGTEFNNKIASELYTKLDIMVPHKAPAHSQCNSQAAVLKNPAKHMKYVVGKSTLNWEWSLEPLMFCYNMP
jgi:hypothetical protein